MHLTTICIPSCLFRTKGVQEDTNKPFAHFSTHGLRLSDDEIFFINNMIQPTLSINISIFTINQRILA